MAESSYQYIVLGAGTAGGAAVEGIREVDPDGSILLLGTERFLPYDRTPLTKKLWTGGKVLQDIFMRPEDAYAGMGVDVRLDSTAVALDRNERVVTDNHGKRYGYESLLFTTGGTPRRLAIAGGDAPGLVYYRTITDYLACREVTDAGVTSVVILGGGFIGAEMAASLHYAGMDVTMVFPEPTLVSRVLPHDFGAFLVDDYRRRGIHLHPGDEPRAIRQEGGGYVVETARGKHLPAQLIVVGIGITPNAHLAESAGLRVHNGIVVNQYLQTDDPAIFAAGDVANFPHTSLDRQMRMEHWDNAMAQGLHAGRTMAGERVPFTYMPYFFSDMFDFGYEAVGDVHTGLDIVADWTVPMQTGALYYLHEGRVRGVLLCNIFGRLDDARELIRSGKSYKPAQLQGRIRPEQAA